MKLAYLPTHLLGELLNVSAQQFEVQASILGAGVATVQGINLGNVSQLVVINSLASIDASMWGLL